MPARLISLFLACIGFVSIAYAAEFADLSSTIHANGIQYLQTKGIIKGYADNTFRPDHSINRVDFLKLLVEMTTTKSAIASCESAVHFKDVPSDSWYAPYVCIATKKAYATGYSDHTFRPAETLTVAEAATMLTKAFTLPLTGTGSGPWYTPYVTALANAHAIPPDVGSPKQNATRGEVADMLWRLDQKITDQPSVSADQLLAAKCQWFTDDQIPHVDIEEVRRVWISWINDARTKEGLASYRQDKELDHTATVWSLQARDDGAISHKRPGQKAYYDYAMIKSWFADLHISFANVARQTFTENIGWGVYSCSKGDCTQKLIDALRTTFDFY
ncbi:MAG TPA: S-layer homology domain-containing protein, partial [Candidatus Peribacteraceae bacterium]|nr:S-layer homology domain-containing protein [Candidatus Peribacteraceae bacterium]